MAGTTIYATAMFDKLDEFMLEFMEHDKTVSAGVAATGPAAAYAEVWEWGNVRQVKPGPKTVLGTNPDGKTVWLSIQAPFGYIKIHENDYWEVLKIELGKVKFSGSNANEINSELEAAANRAMKTCAQLIADSAPIDSGQLRDGFKVVKAGDSLLEEDEDERTLVIG